METPDFLTESDGGLERLKRTLALIGIGYVGLVCLAFYVDHKIQLRRARKKREAREAPQRHGDDPPAT